MTKLHNREYAVEVLNTFFEDLGVFEEDRVVVDRDVKFPEFDEDTTEQEKAEMVLDYERQDAVREKVISAIRRKTLEFNEETKEFSYKLESPIGSGENRITSVTFKRRYKEIELERNMRGVKASDERGTTQAYIATRCGLGKMDLGGIMDDDMGVIQNVFLLFFRRG